MIWRFRLWLPLKIQLVEVVIRSLAVKTSYTSSDKYHCKSPPKAVGTAFAIDRAKDLNLSESKLDNSSIVICSFGDASANHATALSAFNTACWISSQGGHVPIIFICEDNGTGISVPLKKNGLKTTFQIGTVLNI